MLLFYFVHLSVSLWISRVRVSVSLSLHTRILCFSNSTSAVCVTLCFIYGLWSFGIRRSFVGFHVSAYIHLQGIRMYCCSSVSSCSFFSSSFHSYAQRDRERKSWCELREEWRKKEYFDVCACAHFIVCVSCFELNLQMLISILVCTHIQSILYTHTPHISALSHSLSHSLSREYFCLHQHSKCIKAK